MDKGNDKNEPPRFQNRFRKRPVGYGKKAGNYQEPAAFACAIIVLENLIPVYSRRSSKEEGLQIAPGAQIVW